MKIKYVIAILRNKKKKEYLPRSPLVSASLSLGLLCLRRASCSGLARSISLITAGSSSLPVQS